MNTGFSADGSLREYSIADGTYAIPLPEKISFEQAARKFSNEILTV